MEKETRNAIERATQRARRLLEEDYAAQLEGEYDILPTGKILEGGHLKPREAFRRDKIVSVVEHKRAAGMDEADSVADYIRDAAFTTLNRFVALKMLEARGLVQECITKGEESSGYKEFISLAPGLAAIPDGSGYRLYIESLFDELSTEIKVLFDRRDAASILWPRRQTFEDLLATLNVQELAGVWGQDETIGWVYQYFNTGDERRSMRAESQAPRNSRELAVRNQFFTPRYVVQFLTDNTLGRTWFEMMSEKTRLAEACEYLVRTDEPTQAREKKDPRDLRILDPACGSGHFLLYTFDLLLHIYEEAWEQNPDVKSQLTGKSLRDEYPDLAALGKAAPALIVEHNLYGVDIDPRCAQIAALALWLRAQRAWKDANVPSAERPRIRRTHIVVAEPMPGDKKLVDEFASQLQPPILRDLFRKMVQETRLAGDMGVLLRLEKSLEGEITRARTQFAQERGRLTKLVGIAPARRQGELDLSGIDDTQFFHDAETRILRELQVYASAATESHSLRRQLFAEDASYGVALVDVVRAKFDAVLMNPPFGVGTAELESVAEHTYPLAKRELACSFIQRALELVADDGRVGVIATRTPLFIKSYSGWRDEVLHKGKRVATLVDLGRGVLDATVESAAYVLTSANSTRGTFFRAMDGGMVLPGAGDALRDTIGGADTLSVFSAENADYETIPNWPLAYWLRRDLVRTYAAFAPFEADGRQASSGASTNDDFRFLRLWCEVPRHSLGQSRADTFRGRGWIAISKGGEYAPYYRNVELVINWKGDGKECKAFIADYRGQKGWGYHWAAALNGYRDYFRPGITWSRRTSTWISGRALPAGCIFGDKGPAAFVPGDEQDELLAVLGWMNSSVVSSLLELSVGKEGSQGTAASNSYEVGIIERLPYPGAERLYGAGSIAAQAWQLRADLSCDDELSRYFSGATARGRRDVARARALQQELDESVGRAFDLEDATLRELEVGSRLSALESTNPYESTFREVEEEYDALAKVQYLVGCVFERWEPSPAVHSFGPFDVIPAQPPAAKAADSGVRFLVEDEGHPSDIVSKVTDSAGSLGFSLPLDQDLRRYFQREFFERHIASYSRSRRKAPIYWQLSVRSRRYSIWLYLHGLTKDVFFHLQNEVLIPRLTLEENRLQASQSDAGEQASRRARASSSHAELVSELREMLDEIRRVAPLWNPTLDDGVVIVAAPLWRLFPHEKKWQLELLDTWKNLCAGQYDWSQTAVHLWPERVVPKCAEDRSLAIAHGLDDVFWLEAEDGKWSKRAKPTRSIEELVSERTSPAVKAALKSLLEAPPPAGSSPRGRKSKKSGGSE